MLIPVLAAGVIGACLGGTVVELRRRTAPMIPVRLAREIIDVMRGDRDEAHRQAVEAHDMVGLLATRLDLAIRVRVSAELLLARTEDELADVHLELARLRQADRTRADVGAAA